MDSFLGLPSGVKKSAKGQLTTWAPAPGMFVTRAEGHIDVDLTALMVQQGNEVVRRDGKLLGFHEWWGVTTYSPKARLELTEWGFHIRNDVERVHFLVSSKLARMGLSVASLVLVGMLVAHDDKAGFEAQVKDAVTARRRVRGSIPP